ncbi:MAG: hypothetical protein IJ111_11920 [Eggerthellaceae bacterium]|nr:hypothetical protein [Eggerthellaceae bacterium]
MRVTEETVSKLGELYKERLESELISELSRRLEVDAAEAMSTYYGSELARQVDEGANGIQYLSPSYLVDELLAELGIDSPESTGR